MSQKFKFQQKKVLKIDITSLFKKCSTNQLQNLEKIISPLHALSGNISI